MDTSYIDTCTVAILFQHLYVQATVINRTYNKKYYQDYPCKWTTDYFFIIIENTLHVLRTLVHLLTQFTMFSHWTTKYSSDNSKITTCTTLT